MSVIPKDGLIQGADGKTRCWWPSDDVEYMRYHDDEWGYPVDDDIHLFEKICLEGFQSGLSWLTILRKRENFRKAFDGFDYKKIAKYTDKKIENLVQNAGIIRHRGKIISTINNAAGAQDIIKEFGSLAAYFWQFEPSLQSRPKTKDFKILRSITFTAESAAMSKDLKKRGWSFVGPTTCYAFMQSMGIVNDHLDGCHCEGAARKKRKNFKRPLISNING